jgi:histidinol dehydrogenase
MRRYTVQELSREGLENIGDAIMDLADAEGLDAHRNAVKIRLTGLELPSMPLEHSENSAVKSDSVAISALNSVATSAVNSATNNSETDGRVYIYTPAGE